MTIAIKPVDLGTVDAVLALSVAPEQRCHIETTRECLDEAAESPRWRPVGLYRSDTLIGFAMYGKFKDWITDARNERVWLDRLLIDQRYQGHGYGETALRLLLARLKAEYACDTIYLSVYADNDRAIALYQKHGFCFNGELDTKGEKVMAAKV